MEEVRAVIVQQEGTVSCNFEEVEGYIKERLKEYDGAIFTEESKGYAKKELAKLRAEKKELNDNLRDAKKKYMAPWDAFEPKAKELINLFDEPITLIDGQVKAFEEDRIAQKKALIEAIYTELVGDLTDIIPLERIYNPKWENATMKEKAIREATEQRLERQQAETAALSRARTSSDSREEMGREMARLAERKAAAESEYDQTVAKLWDEYQLSVSQAENLCVEFESLTALRAQVADLRGKIRALGSVNVSAIEEYKEVKARYDALIHQVTDVEESRNELTRMISKLSAQMREIFSDSFRAINENFGRVFTELFGGGEASLVLEDESDVLSCGIGIRVAPPGKVIKNLEALSGGEQALVAISIYFAILAVNPAPFCILDEIEAALDDANVVRFAQYLRRVSDKTQFIVITHRRGTMEAANVLYGVTMQEDGVSKLLKLDLEQVDATLVS